MGSSLISSSAPWATFEPKGMMLKAMFPRGLSCGGRVVLLGDPRTPSHSLKYREAHQNEPSGGLCSLRWGAGWGGVLMQYLREAGSAEDPRDGQQHQSTDRPLGAPRSGEGEAWRRDWDPVSQGSERPL